MTSRWPSLLMNQPNPISASADNITVALNALLAGATQGEWVEIEKSDSSSNTVTVTAPGMASVTLSVQGSSAEFMLGQDGNWHCTSGSPTGAYVSALTGGEVQQQHTAGAGLGFNAIVIDAPTDKRQAPVGWVGNTPSLPYFWANGMVYAGGSPGPTPNKQPGFIFDAADGGLWIEAPASTSGSPNATTGYLYLNPNGDNSTFAGTILIESAARVNAGLGSSADGPLLTWRNAGGTLAGWLAAGSAPPFGIRLDLSAQATTETNLLLKGFAGQTALPLMFQTSGSTAVAGIGPDGGLIPGNNSSAVTNTSPALYAGSGAPAAGLGANGSVYFRTDTPGTAGQRYYIKSAGAWTATTL